MSGYMCVCTLIHAYILYTLLFSQKQTQAQTLSHSYTHACTHSLLWVGYRIHSIIAVPEIDVGIRMLRLMVTGLVNYVADKNTNDEKSLFFVF